MGVAMEYLIENPIECKVAIYARVSSELETQINALDNQLAWYDSVLRKNPNWTLVERYIDEGITGTSAKKRPEFMRMIHDAKKHRFNLIITREVSRFARNTVDTLQYTRLLRTWGIEVFFIEDNIRTFAGDGELRLSIMATLAQEESRKISERVKAGSRIAMKNGVFFGISKVLGYDKVGNTLVINPKEAETVRLIYEMYLGGLSLAKIKNELERLYRKTATGSTRWDSAGIGHILSNTLYCGIQQHQKSYSSDYLEQKRIPNRGELEYIYVIDTHEPIVTREEFHRVQMIKASRRCSIKTPKGKSSGKMRGRSTTKTVWGKLLVCQCGRKMYRQQYKREKMGNCVSYICSSVIERQKKHKKAATKVCDVEAVSEWILQMMAIQIFRDYVGSISTTVALAIDLLENYVAIPDDLKTERRKIKQLESELERQEKAVLVYAQMYKEGELSREICERKTDETTNGIMRTRAELFAMRMQAQKRKDLPLDLPKLIQKLASYTDYNEMTRIPESIVETFVRKIVVYKDHFEWYLRTEVEKPVDFSSDTFHPSDLFAESEKYDAPGVRIASFTISKDEARQYLNRTEPKRRIRKWNDVWVDILV